MIEPTKDCDICCVVVTRMWKCVQCRQGLDRSVCVGYTRSCQDSSDLHWAWQLNSAVGHVGNSRTRHSLVGNSTSSP